MEQVILLAILAVVRLRGRIDVSSDVENVLRLLRLRRKFHATLYPEDLPGLGGMLNRASMWITWGEIDYETLVELLRARARALGGRRVDDAYIARATGGKYGSVEELASAIYKGAERLHKMGDIIKPIFRLHPPSGGFKGSIKKPYGAGGELGYRGREINSLLRRMI